MEILIMFTVKWQNELGKQNKYAGYHIKNTEDQNIFGFSPSASTFFLSSFCLENPTVKKQNKKRKFNLHSYYIYIT